MIACCKAIKYGIAAGLSNTAETTWIVLNLCGLGCLHIVTRYHNCTFHQNMKMWPKSRPSFHVHNTSDSCWGWLGLGPSLQRGMACKSNLLSCIAVETDQEIKPSRLVPWMAEQIKLDWLIIKLVRCTSPTHKHKCTVGHIPQSQVCSICTSSISHWYRTTTDELQT